MSRKTEQAHTTHICFYGIIVMGMLCWTLPSHAYEYYYKQLPRKAHLSRLFGSFKGKGMVRDDILIGKGSYTIKLLPNNHLWVNKRKVYLLGRNPATNKIHKLKDPAIIDLSVELTPQLRIIRARTSRSFPPNINESLGGFDFKDQFDWYYDWDNAILYSTKRGDQLIYTTYLKGRKVNREIVDYEPEHIPFSVVELIVGAAIGKGVTNFNFDLLIPGHSTHGIKLMTYKTNTPWKFTRGYRLPKKLKRLLQQLPGTSSVVEMSLSSPIKRLFYPHKFYLVLSSKTNRLAAFWGGDPNKLSYAFNTNPNQYRKP